MFSWYKSIEYKSFKLGSNVVMGISDSMSVCMGVYILKVHNVIIVIYRFDKPPSLVRDHLNLPSSEQSHSQHHHPVYFLSSLLILVKPHGSPHSDF